MRHEPGQIDAAREALLDELLVVRCQLGEQAAFDALIERWHEPLWRYLRRLLGDADAAAETLQDTWVRVLRALPGLREPARLRPWLRRVLFAAHRIVAARMAVAFSALFTLGAALLGPRGGSGWYAAIGVGLVMAAAAVALLVRAHHRFRQLSARRADLERQLAGREGAR